MPSCTARYDSGSVGGVIANARYEVIGVAKGYTNSLPALTATNNSLSKATGTCQPGYWASDRTTNGVTSTTGSAVPKMQCLFANSSNNIDQVYWALSNTQDCKLVQCPAMSPFTPSSTYSSRVAATNITAGNVGDTRSLNCATNTSRASSSNAPTVTCQADGTWTTAIANASSCEASCSGYTGLGNTRMNDAGDSDCCDAGWGFSINASSLTLQSRQQLIVAAVDKAGGGCEQLFVTYSCVDGDAQKRTTWRASDTCYDVAYDPNTRDISNVSEGLFHSDACHIYNGNDNTTTLSYINASGTATTFTGASNNDCW